MEYTALPRLQDAGFSLSDCPSLFFQFSIDAKAIAPPHIAPPRWAFSKYLI
jgi:hypothetical protein